MIVIRAVGSGTTLKLPVEVTRWQTILQSVPKAMSLSGMAQEHRETQQYLEMIDAMDSAMASGGPGGGLSLGPRISVEAKAGVTETLMASVRLPLIRLGFVSAFHHPSRDLLSTLEKWVRPVSTGSHFHDALTAPVSIWTELGSDKHKNVVGIGILQSLQYGWQTRGRGEGSVFQGELVLMDCRLDSDFIKKCHGQNLLGGA
jgi:hypothetical protein